MQMKSTASRVILSAFVVAATIVPVFPQTTSSTSADEVKALKEQLASQQKQIDQLQRALEDQKQLLQAIQVSHGGQTKETATQQGTANGQAPESPSLGEVASLAPVIPAGA